VYLRLSEKVHRAEERLMRAFMLDGFESTPGLRDDVPVPSAGAGELLVRVTASSVNPADAAIASASRAGAHVVAPALPEDGDYLRGLGVGETLDRDSDLVAQVRERSPDGVDAVLDLVSFSPGASLLKEGGRLASSLGAAGEGPERANLMASVTTANLERLAELLVAGSLRVHVQGSYPLERAGEALQTLANEHTYGKLRIAIA
jgi:NADPH:quinone reductase-like Zn-dependent oxidoreductase